MVETDRQHPDLSGMTILVVDDEPAIVSSLERFLTILGARIRGVGSVREARLILEDETPQAVLADLQLKDGRGLDLLPDYQLRCPDGRFYLITGHGSVANAAEAFKRGVRDYFEKPIDPMALAERLAADRGAETGRGELSQRLAPYLMFRDPAMFAALADVPRFALSSEPVLVSGETGTGKELVARALHGLGPRREGPFVAVNCGAIPDTMVEAELFGYEKGAFTGANRMHRGCFEQASQGVLFLDEIGEMPQSTQVSLLRVLEERVVQRIGGERDVPVDVRVIAATHRALEERVESGLFRRDLYFRLAVLPIALPPLRERPSDIPLLARKFLRNGLADLGRGEPAPDFSPAAAELLATHPWSGNVRELRNLMARLALRLPQDVKEIGAELLDALLRDGIAQRIPTRNGVFIPAGTTLEQAEWLLIDAALKQADFNRSQAARLLGIGERTLRRKLNRV